MEQISTPHCAADQNADFNEGFKSYLQEILNNLKNNIETGIPELNIPPLDPLVVPGGVDERLDFGRIQVDNICVEGLKTLNMRDIDADLNNLVAGASIDLEKIIATAKYDCDLLLARIFPIRGNGNVYVEFREVTLQAKIALKSEDFTTFEVTDIEYAIELGGSNINFENIISPQLAPTINRILSGVLPLLTATVLPMVNGWLTPLIIELINKELTKVKLTDLIAKINEP